MRHLPRWCVVALGAWGLATSVMAQAHAPFVALQPEDIKVADGATQTVIMGDPSKPGMYVVQSRTVGPLRRSGMRLACLRNELLPMCPEWTWRNWRAQQDSNLRPPA
jgi:hypothetical protein